MFVVCKLVASNSFKVVFRIGRSRLIIVPVSFGETLSLSPSLFLCVFLWTQLTRSTVCIYVFTSTHYVRVPLGALKLIGETKRSPLVAKGLRCILYHFRRTAKLSSLTPLVYTFATHIQTATTSLPVSFGSPTQSVRCDKLELGARQFS